MRFGGNDYNLMIVCHHMNENYVAKDCAWGKRIQMRIL